MQKEGVILLHYTFKLCTGGLKSKMFFGTELMEDSIQCKYVIAVIATD